MAEDTKVEEEVGERTRKKDEAYVFSFWSFHNIIICLFVFLPQLRLLYSRGGLAQPLLLPLPLRRHLVHCDWGSKLFQSGLVSFFFQMIGGWCFYLPGCSPLWSPPHWKTLSRGNQAKRQHAPTRGIFPSIEFRPNFQVYIVAVWGSFINLTLNYPQVAMAMVLMSVQRRLYNSYLEVVNDCFAFLDPSHHDIVNL